MGLVASLGLAALCGGCAQPAEQPAAAPEAAYSTLMASFTSVMETPHDGIIGYATSLQFDTALAAGDEQPLPVWDKSGNVVGTVNVRVEPERGAANLTDEELRAGRIIGRFIAEAEYPGFGIPQGVSYLWVEGVGDSLRQVIIPATAPDSFRVGPMVIEQHDSAYFGPRPVRGARLLMSRDSVGCNYPCPRLGCCPCSKYLRLGAPPVFEKLPMP